MSFKKVVWVAVGSWLILKSSVSFAWGTSPKVLNPELKKLLPLIQKNRLTLVSSKIGGAKSISFFFHRNGKLERNSMILANRVQPQKFSVSVEGKTRELKPVFDFVLKEYVLKGTDSGRFQQLYNLTEELESEFCLNTDDPVLTGQQLDQNESSVKLVAGGQEFFRSGDLKNYYARAQRIARGVVRFYQKNKFQFENKLNQPVNPLQGQTLFDGSFVIEFVDNVPTRFLTPLGQLEILGKGVAPDPEVTERLKRTLGLIPSGPEYLSANGTSNQLYVVTKDFNGVRMLHTNFILREASEYIEYNSALQLFEKVRPQARVVAE